MALTISGASKASRVNGKRGEVPLACSHLAMFIDVHHKVLFYVVAAWEPEETPSSSPPGGRSLRRRSPC